MTPEAIRLKTQALHAKTRRTLLGGIAAALLVAGISGYGIAHADGPAVRAAFAIAIAWIVAGQYFVNRGMWPEEAAPTTGLESYRLEVERRRYLSGSFLLWTLGPLALAIAALIALLIGFGMGNRGMLLTSTLFKMTPFLTLLVVWMAGVFVIRMRDRRELQREIDDLKDLES